MIVTHVTAAVLVLLVMQLRILGKKMEQDAAQLMDISIITRIQQRQLLVLLLVLLV